MSRTHTESSLISKSTLPLLQTHGRLQVPECGSSAIHDAHGLFKMPERVSQRWIAHIRGSRLGPSISAFSLQPVWLGFSTLLAPGGSQMGCCQGQQAWRVEKVTALERWLQADQWSLAHHLLIRHKPFPLIHLIPFPHLHSLPSLISILAPSGLPCPRRQRRPCQLDFSYPWDVASTLQSSGLTGDMRWFPIDRSFPVIIPTSTQYWQAIFHRVSRVISRTGYLHQQKQHVGLHCLISWYEHYYMLVWPCDRQYSTNPNVQNGRLRLNDNLIFSSNLSQRGFKLQLRYTWCSLTLVSARPVTSDYPPYIHVQYILCVFIPP